MKPKQDLIRILREEETGRPVIDETGRRNGRGCYICRSVTCLDEARKRRGVERSLKCSISAETWDELYREMTRFADG